MPAEAAVVAEVFERVAAGDSINLVTVDLRARGAKRVSGASWAYQATLRMLDSPIYAGRLTNEGQGAGPASEDIERLVSADLFDAANARRERKPSRVTGRARLLSGLAVCGRCFTPMTATGRKTGGLVYVCNRQACGCGNLTIVREPLDRLIESAVKTDKLFEGLAPTSGQESAEALARLDAQVAEVEARRAETRTAMASGGLPFEGGQAILEGLRGQTAALAKARAVEVESSGEFLKPLSDFESADLHRRHAEVTAKISAVGANPAKVRGSTKFDPSRVE